MSYVALIYNQKETIIVVAVSSIFRIRSDLAISRVLWDSPGSKKVRRYPVRRLMYRLTVASPYQAECPSTRLIRPQTAVTPVRRYGAEDLT